MGEQEFIKNENQVGKLARQLFQEDFKKLPQDQFGDEQVKDRIKNLKSQLIN